MVLNILEFNESPFDPGHPVSPEKFKGRQDDVEKILRYIPKIINQKRPEHFFITGKRGMGKTSFVDYISKIVEENFQMIPIYVNNDGKHKIDDLIQILLEEIFSQLHKETWGKKIIETFTENIQEIKISGVGISLKNKPELIQDIKQNFSKFIINISNSLKDKKGLFIIIDDINGLSDTPDFANWYKSLSDTIDFSHEEIPVAFTLVSYPNNFDKLAEQNPSFARIFHLIEIDHLENNDIKEFFQETFENNNITIKDENSLNQMIYYSWGMPLIMQQIGDGVFWNAQDNEITEKIALNGILDAALEIGNKQIRQKLARIKSKYYESILLKLGQNKEIVFKKSEIKKILNKNEEGVFDDFLIRMKELNIIIPINNKKTGEYTFENRLYFVYFLIIANIKQQS